MRWQSHWLIDIEAKGLGIHAMDNVEETEEMRNALVQQYSMGRVCDGGRRERNLRGRDVNGPKFGASRPHLA